MVVHQSEDRPRVFPGRLNLTHCEARARCEPCSLSSDAAGQQGKGRRDLQGSSPRGAVEIAVEELQAGTTHGKRSEPMMRRGHSDMLGSVNY